MNTLVPRTTARWKKLYHQRGAVEREFGYLKHEFATTGSPRSGGEKQIDQLDSEIGEEVGLAEWAEEISATFDLGRSKANDAATRELGNKLVAGPRLRLWEFGVEPGGEELSLGCSAI